MRCQMLCHIPERGVRHHSDLLDAPVMVSNKTHMSDQCAETLPARKRWRIDDQAAEAAVCFDIGING